MSGQIDAKPCPRCGKPPRLITTLTSMHYLAWLEDHLETQACQTESQAIALWNAAQYEQQAPATRPRDASYYQY